MNTHMPITYESSLKARYAAICARTFGPGVAKAVEASCVAGDNPGQHEPMCDWCSNNERLQRGLHNPKKAAAAAQAIQEAARA